MFYPVITHSGAPQGNQVSTALQSLAYITGQCSYVCSLTANHPNGNVRKVALCQFQFVNDQRLGFEFHIITFSGHLVGTLAVNLAGREGGRNLLYLSFETLQHLLHHLTGYMLRGVGGVNGFFQVI